MMLVIHSCHNSSDNKIPMREKNVCLRKSIWLAVGLMEITKNISKLAHNLNENKGIYFHVDLNFSCLFCFS